MIKLINILKENLLAEYSEKTIADTLTRWGIDPNDKDKAKIARSLIQNFDQNKRELNQKLDIVVLPDSIKKGDYRNIDLYSYEDMERLIKSLPQNPEKIKKEAIKRFEEQGIDKQTAQSYTARFMNKKADLKYAFENGTENGQFTKEEVKNYIPAFLQRNELYLDPRNWKWQAFEQILDALFPSFKKVEGEENIAETDADKIYDKNGIEVYKCDAVHKCIQYNPTIGNRKKYGWCVAQPGNTTYNYYRFGDKSPTFYFIFNRNKTSTPNNSPFEDIWHAIALQVNTDGNSYVVTNANNSGDIKASTWESISGIVDTETWNAIKDLQPLFKPVALSAVERGQKMAQGKNLSLNEFKELDQEDKILYIVGKASKNQISQEILDILPKYKVQYEGRTTTLANIAINSGQKFKYSDLKEYESLANHYAVYRFRHTNYGKEPIPLPFVKYLNDEAKQKYLDTFNDNISYEYIEKYFGEKATEDYVKKQLKNLDYLPPEAAKYIKDPQQRKLFEIYNKLFEPWEKGAQFELSDAELENVANMPENNIYPVLLSYDQWVSLSSQERKTLLDLAKKVNGNDQYLTLLYGLPFIVKNNNDYYYLLPVDNSSPTDDNYDNYQGFKEWVLVDENNKIIKNKIDGETSSIDGKQLIDLRSENLADDPVKIFDSSNVSINKEPLSNSLKETPLPEKFQRMAGIQKETKIAPKDDFDSFIKSLDTYLQKTSRKDMFSSDGNYNPTLKKYHKKLRYYAENGSKEEQTRANFVMGLMGI
jgi:hypothetical protein